MPDSAQATPLPPNLGPQSPADSAPLPFEGDGVKIWHSSGVGNNSAPKLPPISQSTPSGSPIPPITPPPADPTSAPNASPNLFSQLGQYLNIVNEHFFSGDKKKKIKTSSESSAPTDEWKLRAELDAKAIEAFTKNAEIDRRLKSKYACPILIVVGLQIVAFNVVIILNGLSVLNYPDASIMQYFITSGVVEIISLAVIIIRYLFSDNVSKALKYVLENNKTNK